MPFCSIIVPVYKTEEYLDRCISSILNQSLEDFELILVDDGSTDRCPEICDGYAKTDDRIRVIHKTNGGVSSARNQGMQCAAGDYCWFVDSDDYIPVYALAQLLSVIKQKEADLYIFNCKGIKDYFTGYFDDFMNKYYFSYILGFGPCNKLYRTSVIKANGLYYDEEEPIGEDLLFNLRYYQAIMGGGKEGRCFFLGEDYYEYNNRAGSAMHTKSKNRLTQQMRLFGKARNLLQNDVSEHTLTYLFLLHIISGIHQSREGGISCREFSSFDFSPYRHEIMGADHVLSAFFRNEKASIPGKARIKAFCHEMQREHYMLAGRIMGLK